MILRRVTEHVKAQNWFAVGIDFCIVVVGVFIGIQVSNWNDNQHEKRLAREYVGRIQQDLLTTKHEMAAYYEYADWIKRHAERALDALVQEPVVLDETFVVDAYIAGHSISVSLQRDTYEELLSVGALTTISDLETRQRISQFFRYGDTVEEAVVVVPDYQAEMRRVMPHDVATALRTVCGVTIQRDDPKAPVFEMPSDCPPSLTPEQVSRAAASLREAALLPSLREALSDVEVKQSYLQEILDQSKTLHEFLAEQP